MRRLASAVLFTAVVSAALPSATAFAGQDQAATAFAAHDQTTTALATQDQAATVKTEANLRAEPNTESAVRAVMPEGTAVEVVCWTQGEPTYGTDKYGSMWLYLAEDGWVHSALITPVDVPPCSTGTGTAGFFDNCDEARAAGAAPVRAGSPNYGLHLDRDRDGVGCEWD